MDPQQYTAYAQHLEEQTEAVLHNASAWMQNFIQADSDKNKMMKILLDEVTKQKSEIEQLRRDKESETESRTMYQKRHQEQLASNLQLKKKINEGSFVAVLVDGDGSKFADELLRNPAEGAPRAAQLLKLGVRDYMIDNEPGIYDDSMTTLIRVYANVADLGKSLRYSGVIEHEDFMIAFAEKASNSRAEFDFVNVGKGKENADSKIRKMLHHYLMNVHCRKIFISCCHDNGYLHELRGYSDMLSYREKIVLLETTPAEPGFATLGYPITRFDKVFRSQPLQNETKRFSASSRFNNSAHTLFEPMQPPLTAYTTKAEHAANTRSDTHSAPAIGESHSPPPMAVTAASKPERQTSPSQTLWNSGNGGMSISYATAGGVDSHQNISIRLKSKKESPKVMLFNTEGNRIDPPSELPVNGAAQASYKEKGDQIKPGSFCNDHYLRGSCTRRVIGTCKRVHDVSLTPAEIAIHRYKARTSVCTRGPQCQDYDCYLSHHCPKDPRCTRGSACAFYNSDFGNLHLSTDAQLKPATKWTEGITFPENLLDS